MLDVIAGILPILGIVVLALLAVMAVLLLLALFFPVVYKIHGTKDPEKFRLTVKAGWLFGLVRVRYSYPEPGRLTAKVLFFTLLNQKIPGGEETEEDGGSSGDGNKEKRGRKKKVRDRGEASQSPGGEGTEHSDTAPGSGDGGSAENAPGSSHTENAGTDSGRGHTENTGAVPVHSSMPAENTGISGPGGSQGGNAGRSEDSREDSGAESGRFSSKIEKIKYTIRSICDKIKGIWENISYYAALLQEEGTKQLFTQTLFRTGKILKNIRPRHIKAEILFGTGSPDTTGYAYGFYCMAVPFLGGARVEVTPDFEEAVLRGELEISGHVTLWVLVVNVLRLFFDKNLRSFLGRMKTGKKEASE